MRRSRDTDLPMRRHRYVTLTVDEITVALQYSADSISRPTMLDTGRAGYHCPRVSN